MIDAVSLLSGPARTDRPIAPRGGARAGIGRDRAAFAAVAAIAGFALFLILPFTLDDGDTGWHLATGAWILAHGAVPVTDPFSFTAAGRAWVAHEWLSEVAMHLAYRLGGWSGLVLLFATAVAALYAIVALHLSRWLGTPAAITALIAMTAGVLPSMLARPHLLALPLLAGWTVVMLAARASGRRPGLGWAALMVVWANAHGSFVLGLGLAAVFAAEHVVAAPPRDRARVVREWATFGGLLLAAALATPAGLHALTFPFYVSDLALLSELSEWQPTSFRGITAFEVVLLGTLFVLLVRPTRIPPFRLLILLGALHLTLQHTRQEIVLVVLGALLLAEPIGSAFAARPRPCDTIGRRQAIAALALFAAAATLLAAPRLAGPIARPDAVTVPATALRHVPAAVRGQAVFNDYSFGGALILAGMRPYIDGRSDMYGDAFTLDFFRILRGDAARWRRADRRWRFGWTILSPKARLARMLDADPRWRVVYRDAVAVIHVRDAAPATSRTRF